MIGAFLRGNLMIAATWSGPGADRGTLSGEDPGLPTGRAV